MPFKMQKSANPIEPVPQTDELYSAFSSGPPPWRNSETVWVVCLLLLLISIPIFAISKLIEGVVLAILGLLFVSLIFLCTQVARRSTNGRMREFLRNPGNYYVFNDRNPMYRYVDWYHSVERLAGRSCEARRLNHARPGYGDDLLTLIKSTSLKPPITPVQHKICIGYEQVKFYPEEVFWLIRGPNGDSPEERVVIRIQYRNGMTFVEVAARNADFAQSLLRFLDKDSIQQSIFRGAFLEISYYNTPHPDYEYQHHSNEMIVTFKEKPNVTPADIILDPKIDGILKRNLFDFFSRRDFLHQLGIPRKRALLFYGPPGTGKTHTCRYIHTQLKGITSIIAAGQSLVRLADVTKFARQLQPTLMIVEDVDLVFASREINPYGTSLGDLMDQLDGFAPDEEVIFILTTNAIDRVEAAIRDRPGRINQLLFFGMPSAELRHRYLTHYLEPYDLTQTDMDHLVRKTEQTSQAFLKEYVLRAVQIASEEKDFQPGNPVKLKTEHFDIAFDEITSHGDPHGHSIMGFQAGAMGKH
jgi:hypothetical protein